MQIKRLTAGLAALMLLLAAVSGAAAAATFDNETTSTPTTSDASGASTTVTLDPGNSSETLYIETDGATTSNLSMELTPAQTNVSYVAYKNATPDTENASAGHYSWSVSHNEIEDLPRDKDGGTYNLTVYNTTSGAEVMSTEVTFSTGTNDDTAIIAVTDDSGSDASAMTNLVADRMELSTEDSWTSSIWGDDNGTDIATWSGYTTVNGTSSDVVVQMQNTTTADAYAGASEDVDEGEWMKDSTVWINGVPHKVYKDSTPDDLDDDQTTVVYDSSTDELTADLNKDHYSGTQNVNIRATAGEGYGFGELWSNFGAGTAFASLVP